MKRTRLRSVGARAAREQADLLAFQAAIQERAGGCCERCGKRRKVHAHHLLPRSRGGKHTPENGAGLCRWCHDSVHAHSAEDWRAWVR